MRPCWFALLLLCVLPSISSTAEHRQDEANDGIVSWLSSVQVPEVGQHLPDLWSVADKIKTQALDLGARSGDALTDTAADILNMGADATVASAYRTLDAIAGLALGLQSGGLESLLALLGGLLYMAMAAVLYTFLPWAISKPLILATLLGFLVYGLRGAFMVVYTMSWLVILAVRAPYMTTITLVALYFSLRYLQSRLRSVPPHEQILNSIGRLEKQIAELKAMLAETHGAASSSLQ